MARYQPPKLSKRELAHLERLLAQEAESAPAAEEEQFCEITAANPRMHALMVQAFKGLGCHA